jgi:hypothetical protein
MPVRRGTLGRRILLVSEQGVESRQQSADFPIRKLVGLNRENRTFEEPDRVLRESGGGAGERRRGEQNVNCRR